MGQELGQDGQDSLEPRASDPITYFIMDKVTKTGELERIPFHLVVGGFLGAAVLAVTMGFDELDDKARELLREEIQQHIYDLYDIQDVLRYKE